MPNVAMPDKTPEVFAYLKQCARDERTAEYGEIGDQKDVNLQPAFRLIPLLDYIRDKICVPQGLPWISALVVNKETRLPGNGWLPEGTTIADAHLPLFWRGIVLQVYATDWSKVEI